MTGIPQSSSRRQSACTTWRLHGINWWIFHSQSSTHVSIMSRIFINEWYTSLVWWYLYNYQYLRLKIYWNFILSSKGGQWSLKWWSKSGHERKLLCEINNYNYNGKNEVCLKMYFRPFQCFEPMICFIAKLSPSFNSSFSWKLSWLYYQPDPATWPPCKASI